MKLKSIYTKRRRGKDCEKKIQENRRIKIFTSKEGKTKEKI